MEDQCQGTATPPTHDDGRKLRKIVIINNSKTSQDNEVNPDEVFELLISPNFSAVGGVAGSAPTPSAADSLLYRQRPNHALKQLFASLRYAKTA